MLDSVNTAMNGDQGALCDPAPQFAIGDAGAEKLSAGDYSMGSRGQLGKLPLDCAGLSTHTVL
jgi:hypothetical protein